MHAVWIEKGGFLVAEQRFVDQKRLIFQRKWLSNVEIEEIRRSSENRFDFSIFEDTDREEQWFLGFDKDGNGVYEPKDMIIDIENGENHQRLDDEVEPQEEEDAFQLKEGAELNEEEMKILEKLREILKEDKVERLLSLRIVEKSKLMKTVKIVNNLIGKIQARNITETNKLIYAGAYAVSDMVGMIKPKTEKKEPWWKRRLEGQVKQMRRDLGFINKLIEKKKVKKKWRKILDTKYKIQKKKLTVVQEEIKQRIVAKQQKIKRYQNHINQFQQNRTFKNNQGRFYQNLNSGGQFDKSDVPGAEEAKKFWQGIWEEEKVHNKDAKWFMKFKEELHGKEKQAKIIITKDKMMKSLRKMSNWKSPGPDNVQGFWLKNFTTMHDRLLNNLTQCIEEGNVPDWMTKGKTVSIQKDKSKGNVASNYTPITCLPLVWKLMTGIIPEKIYSFLSTEFGLPEEQKGCRKNSRGTNDLLFIDKVILREVKMRKKNLSMAWIDYKEGI